MHLFIPLPLLSSSRLSYTYPALHSKHRAVVRSSKKITNSGPNPPDPSPVLSHTSLWAVTLLLPAYLCLLSLFNRSAGPWSRPSLRLRSTQPSQPSPRLRKDTLVHRSHLSSLCSPNSLSSCFFSSSRATGSQNDLDFYLSRRSSPSSTRGLCCAELPHRIPPRVALPPRPLKGKSINVNPPTPPLRPRSSILILKRRQTPLPLPTENL